MHIKDESKVEKGVRWKITFNANEIPLKLKSLYNNTKEILFEKGLNLVIKK